MSRAISSARFSIRALATIHYRRHHRRSRSLHRRRRSGVPRRGRADDAQRAALRTARPRVCLSELRAALPDQCGHRVRRLPSRGVDSRARTGRGVGGDASASRRGAVAQRQGAQFPITSSVVAPAICRARWASRSPTISVDLSRGPITIHDRGVTGGASLVWERASAFASGRRSRGACRSKATARYRATNPCCFFCLRVLVRACARPLVPAAA